MCPVGILVSLELFLSVKMYFELCEDLHVKRGENTKYLSDYLRTVLSSTSQLMQLKIRDS